MGEINDDVVGDLAGDADVDRVILQDEVKLFRARQTVAYLDGGVYDFAACSVTFGANPVPVYNDEMKQLGFASMSLLLDEGLRRRLFADISIDYATEERLLTETKSVKLYPRVFGQMRFPAMALFDFAQKLTPTYLRIDGIQLSRLPSNDPRVLPFGDLL